MRYFTKDEARRIMSYTGMGLCLMDGGNPNHEAMKALSDKAEEEQAKGLYYLACAGFLLGRATGIREERARRGSR